MLAAPVFLIISIVCVALGFSFRKQAVGLSYMLWGAAGAALGTSFLLNDSWIGLLFMALAVVQLIRAHRITHKPSQSKT